MIISRDRSPLILSRVIPRETRDLGLLKRHRRNAVTIAASELDRNRFAVGLGGLEELPRLKAEHTGKNIRREHLNLGIEIAHHSVVVASRVLDRVFRLNQRSLHLREFL